MSIFAAEILEKTAQMAELVDALVSGTSVRKDVQVRVLFWAQDKPLNRLVSRFIFLRLLPLLNL